MIFLGTEGVLFSVYSLTNYIVNSNIFHLGVTKEKFIEVLVYLNYTIFKKFFIFFLMKFFE